MIRAVLTDIEGTTSSIAFVKNVLFPYARRHLAEFIRRHAEDKNVARLLEETGREAGHKLSVDEAIEQLHAWMESDAKVTPLKELQGLIWEAGYGSGDYHGHIYVDAVEKLRQWHKENYRLYVYSSGSVPAQKLLFSHTKYGDLTPLFDGYFDTRVGHKREPVSYEKIATEIGVPANTILFLSDIAEELDAASATGCLTTQLVREADGTVASANHPCAASFHEIELNRY